MYLYTVCVFVCMYGLLQNVHVVAAYYYATGMLQGFVVGYILYMDGPVYV